MDQQKTLNGKTALITGAAVRIGAAITRQLHQAGAHVILHYRSSSEAAEALQKELLDIRPNSASLLQADLGDFDTLAPLIKNAVAINGRLDVLINNASSYYPTDVGSTNIEQWDDLFASNARAPYFLAQAATDSLRKHKGCIVNLVDIYAERPNPGYPVYCMAKAANAMMVKALAQELAPDIRVNGVAPGAALWPEEFFSDEKRQKILERIPMGQPAGADQIAEAVMFMVTGSNYVTGQILAVDGGRSVQQ